MQKGIALYFVVVITGIGLAIALGVADIVFLESRVTRGLLPSFAAFFTADAGAECALYWHFDQDFFDPAAPLGSMGNIVCNNSSTGVVHTRNGAVDFFDFSFNYLNPVGSPYCVTVRVAKTTAEPDFPSGCTSVRSSGQNRACGGTIVDSTLERTLLVRDPEACQFSF